MHVTKHLMVIGRVQGVFFRESMCRKAAALGVAGWVRNRSDGSLEAVIQGSEVSVNAMIAWARNGPELAQVERMEISDASGEYQGFRRRDTV